LVATTHSKNMLLLVSNSHKIGKFCHTSLLFCKLSLVRFLLLDSSHREKCTLGGTFRLHT
jgi:hypothetical protein